jgi:hypothetical protein
MTALPAQGVVSLQQSSPTRRTAVPVRALAAAPTLARTTTRARNLSAKLVLVWSVMLRTPPFVPAGSE